MTGTDWVLALEFDERGRARLEGVTCTDAGTVDVFVSGLIYDRADWIRELALDRDTSAAQIVRVALIRYGFDAVARLRGSFAIAALDRRTETFRIYRDPLGSHPLFYTTSGGRLLCAATPRALLRQPGVPADLNRAALADHLCKRWPERQETFFSAIRRVPPGWVVEATSTRVVASRYWNPVGETIEWLSDDESDRFDSVLDRAVDRGLEGGPTGIFLSGGFDSVSVAAVAADRARQLHRPAPLALSLGFPDPDCNEQPVQTAVAETLNLSMRMLPFAEAAGARGLLAEALEMNAHLAAPGFNTWFPAYASLLRLATSEGVHTIFTGEGGDEWLGVTPFLAADLLRRFRFADAFRLAQATQRSYRPSWPSVLRNSFWRYGLRPLASMWMSRLSPERWDRSRANRAQAAIPPWVAPDPAIRRTQFDRALHSLAPADPAGGFYGRESKLLLDHPLTSWQFEEQFALGMPLGVRFVHPYWDPDVLVLAYRTRPERLNLGGRSKGLVRETMARRFPALGFERQRKVTALNFFSNLARAEGPPLGEAHADFRALSALGVVDARGAREFMRSAWSGTPHQIGRAWLLVNLESWARHQLH